MERVLMSVMTYRERIAFGVSIVKELLKEEIEWNSLCDLLDDDVGRVLRIDNDIFEGLKCSDEVYDIILDKATRGVAFTEQESAIVQDCDKQLLIDRYLFYRFHHKGEVLIYRD